MNNKNHEKNSNNANKNKFISTKIRARSGPAPGLDPSRPREESEEPAGFKSGSLKERHGISNRCPLNKGQPLLSGARVNEIEAC